MDKTLHFDHKPSFADLWGSTARILYDEEAFSNELIEFIKKNNVGKSLADVAAGDGFPSLTLRRKGLEIDCFDLSDDQIEGFKKNAKRYRVNDSITQASWLQLPSLVEKNKYSFVMCRGNSFIYAPGGWNSINYNNISPLNVFRKTLEGFFQILSPNGMLYLDKYKDDEKDHNTPVCKVQIEGRTYNLIFRAKVSKSKRERYATMVLGNKGGEKETLPNYTYTISWPEIISLAEEVGFRDIKKVSLKNEKMFEVYTMRK